MRGREKTKAEPQGGTWLFVMCQLLKGGVMAGACALLILLVGAALVSFGVLKEGVIPGILMFACVVGALIGSVMTTGRIPQRSLLVGLGVGVILFLLLATAGVMAYGILSPSGQSLGIFLSCCCGGALAGIFRRKPKKKRKR